MLAIDTCYRRRTGTYGSAVMAIELHLLPDRQKDRSQDEDGRPVLQLVAAVDAGVETRQFLQNVLLQFTPHVGHGTLDLEVDHHRRHRLAVELRRAFLDLSEESFLLAQAFHHGHVQRQVVGNDELQGLPDDGQFGAEVVPERGFQHLRQERGALEVVVDEFLESAVAIDVTVQVIGQQSVGDAFHSGRKFGGLHLVLRGFPVHRFNPVDAEALLIPHVDLAGVDRENLAVAMGDEEGSFLVRESLDVSDGESETDVTLVVGFPVLHEVPNLLDVNSRAGNLPQPSVRRLATRAGLTLVAL